MSQNDVIWTHATTVLWCLILIQIPTYTVESASMCLLLKARSGTSLSVYGLSKTVWK